MKALTTAALALVLATPALAAEYQVDPAHSRVGFSVRHLMSRVTGDFKEFTGTFDFDEAKKAFGAATLEVKAASIETGIAKRDEHLRSADFFDVTKFPVLKASAGKVTAGSSPTTFKWATDLTLHGVTKPVVFDLEYLGAAKDPWGNDRVGFQAKTKLNRKDFGLNWNQVLEAGGVMVGDDIDVTVDVEAVKAVAKTASK